MLSPHPQGMVDDGYMSAQQTLSAVPRGSGCVPQRITRKHDTAT